MYDPKLRDPKSSPLKGAQLGPQLNQVKYAPQHARHDQNDHAIHPIVTRQDGGQTGGRAYKICEMHSFFHSRNGL